MSATFRIGLDVGGTFTDLFLLNEATGETVRHKLPSTPKHPYEAPVQGIREILEKAGADPRQVRFVGLGTTVSTNALLERKGAATGLLTTQGFRDLLEIGRQRRPHVYDVRISRPPPLVPRRRREEVPERMAADGSVIRELDEDALRQAVRRLLDDGADSVAICFLNAYVSPQHERRAAALLAAEFPDLAVTVSSELLPEFREYERLSTTATNAFLMPVMRRYLTRFREEVAALGIPEAPFVMTSGGGVASPELAGTRPIDTLFSGPSGGVSAATYLAELSDSPDLITFDMGGTSTDVCLVRGGRPEITHSRTIHGLPIRATAVDIHTVGAGGSSIAWIDAGGLLQVGPHSAGADPGPACYGRGGTEPTVTDANVVLGRLNPEYLLSGALKIDAARSHEAIERMVAKPKGLSVTEAAAAILTISNINIARAIRFVSVERGLDPAEFALVAFGGAGPLHAAAVAAELGMTVIIPPAPGVLCAMGVLCKDVQIDLSQTRILRAGQGSDVLMEAMRPIYGELQGRAAQSLRESGLDPAGLAVECTVDARYVGQNFELTVTLPHGPIGEATLQAVRDAYDAEHIRLYGYAKPDAELELVTFRLTARLAVPRPDLTPAEAATRPAPLAPVATRRVFFESVSGVVDAPVYQRSDLRGGDRLDGPAIVEQMDATTVLPPGAIAEADRLGNLRVTVARH